MLRRGGTDAGKKENRDAFLARTQQNRQARQHNKEMEIGALRIQSFYRCWTEVSKARSASRHDFDSMVEAGADSTDRLARLLCRVNFFCRGTGNGVHRPDDLQRIMVAVKLLHTAFGEGVGTSGYASSAICDPGSVASLQVRRICELLLHHLDSTR